MSWLLGRKIFTPDDIPEGAVGIIYLMTVTLPGVNGSLPITYRYIGKKNFYADVKTKLGKKAKAQITDKRLKTYKRIRKFTYENYYSSNEVLKKAHADGIDITREILYIAYSKGELSYQEVLHQFLYNVLEDPSYLNNNILGKFYLKNIR